MMPTDPIPMLAFFGLTILRIGVPLVLLLLAGTAVQRMQMQQL